MTQPVSTEGMVPVQYADGTKEAVRPEDMGQAIRAGGKPITGPSALASATPDTSAAEQFATFGLKGLDALTMGASDAFLGSEWSGAPVSNIQTANRMYEENPRAGMAGTIGGLIAGGGEMGALGGEAAGGLVTRGLAREGAGALEQFAVRRISDAARGAVEMMPINVGQQISEDALGDKTTNGEKLLAAMFNRDTALGAGLGAGLGGGLELAGRLIPKGVKPTRTIDDLLAGVDGAGRGVRADAANVSRQIDELQLAGLTSNQAQAGIAEMKNAAAHAPGVLDDAAFAAARASAGGDAQKLELLQRQYLESTKRVLSYEDTINKGTIDLADAGTVAVQKTAPTMNAEAFTMKPQQFRRLVDESFAKEGRDATIRIWQDARNTIDELKAKVAAGDPMGAKQGFGTWLKKADLMMENFSDAWKSSGGKSNADMMIRADQFKKTLAGYANFGEKDLFLTPQQNAFRGLYDRTRVALEDATAWGEKAATAQKEINATTQATLAKRGQMLRSLVEDDGTNYAGSALDRVSTDKAHAFLTKVGDDLGQGASRDTEQAVRGYLDTQRAQWSAMEKHLDLSPQAIKDLAAGREALDKMETTLDHVKKEASVVGRLKRARAEETGHGIGGLLGLVTDTAMRPITQMDRLGALQHAIDRVTKAGKSNVERIAEGAKAAPAQAMPRSTVETLIGRLRSLAGNPEALAAHAQELAGEMPRYAPGHSSAVAAQLSRAVMYLAAAAPKGWKPSGIMQTSAPTRYGDQELSEFHEKAAAVLDPLGTIEAGRISLAQMQAVKATSPNIYAEWQQAAIEKLSHLSAAGKLDDMSYAQKLRMTIFLDVPADDTLTPDFIAAMQSAKSSGQSAGGQPSSGGGAATKPQGHSLRRLPADNMQTDAQRLQGIIK